ncbi:MAG: discoidin domain-containing protein [Trueperaceae bacterium]|nr:discoidin domain-containing protein [Trueperaceae bacterium]
MSTVALWAAGWATAQDMPEVHALEPFVEGEIEIGTLQSTHAVLPFTTTLDLACVLVFGTDDSFGRLALDQNMGGAAHRDHRIVLSDLEPDTRYRFRLQGSAPDGRLFASRTYSFRTPVAETSDRFGPRLEDLRVEGVSSQYSDAFAAANAVDGDGASEWSSAGDGNEAWIELALPGATELSGVGVWTRTMSASARIERFEIRTDDGRRFGPFELPNADGLHRFEVPATASSLRLEVLSSTGGNTGLVEFEAYAAP